MTGFVMESFLPIAVPAAARSHSCVSRSSTGSSATDTSQPSAPPNPTLEAEGELRHSTRVIVRNRLEDRCSTPLIVPNYRSAPPAEQLNVPDPFSEDYRPFEEFDTDSPDSTDEDLDDIFDDWEFTGDWDIGNDE